MQVNYVSYVAPVKFASTNISKIQFDYEVIQTLNNYDLLDSKISEIIPYTKNILDYLKNKLEFNFAEYVIYYPNTATTMTVLEGSQHHIPVITNAGVYIMYDSQSFRLFNDGTIYTVNVNKPHSVVNAGIMPAIHLVLKNQ